MPNDPNFKYGDEEISAAQFIAKTCAQLGLPVEICVLFQSILAMSGDPATMIGPERLAETFTRIGERFGVKCVVVERDGETVWSEVIE